MNNEKERQHSKTEWDAIVIGSGMGGMTTAAALPTRTNHWFYESWTTNDIICSPAGDQPIPWMFISFPSLKDPMHDPGPSNRHTG